ncbi:cation transporter [Agromyces allii]|uniref:Cation transporter n=1 Tax=Agromyces allii TaxID=393607 RepID=A0ABP5BUU9_9MICO|nr:cation transporter [Agromyces allii]
MSLGPSGERRAVLQQRIRWIVGFTIVYNLIEAAVAIAAGATASSAALFGFGLDSLVEVLSAAAVAWQFTRADPARYEKPTLRVIAFSFFALAAYVGITAVLTIAGALPEAEHTAVGLAITALSVVVMPVVSWIERRTGRELGSATAVADSRQTLICTYLSAAVLIGLALNSLLGWAWADSLAALVIAVFAVREGVEAWRGDTCATPIGMLLDEEKDDVEASRGADGGGASA